MAKLNEKTVLNRVDAAIKSSKDHHAVLLSAVASCIMFAAENGRAEPLDRLYQGVSRSDSDAIRWYMVNLANEFGATEITESGKERKVFFLSYVKAEKKWKFGKSAASIETRKTIASKSETEMLTFVDDPLNNPALNRDDAAEKAFDGFDIIAKAMKRAVEGDPSLENFVSDVVRRLPQGYRFGVHEAAQKAEKRLADLRKEQARLTTVIERAKAGKQEVPATNEPVSKVA